MSGDMSALFLIAYQKPPIFCFTLLFSSQLGMWWPWQLMKCFKNPTVNAAYNPTFSLLCFCRPPPWRGSLLSTSRLQNGRPPQNGRFSHSTVIAAAQQSHLHPAVRLTVSFRHGIALCAAPLQNGAPSLPPPLLTCLGTMAPSSLP